MSVFTKKCYVLPMCDVEPVLVQATTASQGDMADGKNAENTSSEVTKDQSALSERVLTAAARSGQSATSGAVLASAAEPDTVPLRPRGRVRGARRSRVTSSDCAIGILQVISRAGSSSFNTIQYTDGAYPCSLLA